MILECITGAALEWNLPLWALSLDLRKVFDKLEHNALISSLTVVSLVFPVNMWPFSNAYIPNKLAL